MPSRQIVLLLLMCVMMSASCGGSPDSLVNTGQPVELTPTDRIPATARVLTTSTDPPADPTPTQGVPQTQATTTPIPVDRWSSTSPDGKWIAEGMMEGPFASGDEEKYHYQLKAARADGRVQWTIVDETARWGLGYTTPRPFQWSKDGRYLYWTNKPVPDGCAVFVNGSDLERFDLQTGRGQEIVSQGPSWLSLSPDEKQVAYIYWNSKALEIVLQDLATGARREATLEGAGNNSQAGNIVWSPDGQRFVLAVASNPCDPPNWTHSIILIDRATLTQRVLIQKDKRLLVPINWPQPEQVLLQEQNGKSWWMDARSGELHAAEPHQLDPIPTTRSASNASVVDMLGGRLLVLRDQTRPY